MGGARRLVVVGSIYWSLGFVAVAHTVQAPLGSPNPNPSLDAALREQPRQIQLEQDRFAREQQARDAKNLASPIQLPETFVNEISPSEADEPC